MKLQERNRKKALKLSNPSPIELSSGRWRCQITVDGKRYSMIEDAPDTAHAKALALKAGIIKAKGTISALTVGQAMERYINAKDAILSPSTIYNYKNLRSHALP